MRIRRLYIALLFLVCASVAGAGSLSPPVPARPDMLVGAFYFPGWGRPESWYCIRASQPTLHPLLGYYDQASPQAADWHIRWALEHGVSFFAYDYYSEGGSQMLESALDDGLLRSRYLPQFRFCLNWCNHGDVKKMDERELARFGEIVVPKYLCHPSYLRVDGKPVVMILAGASFVKTLGVERARTAFGQLEQRCKDAGLPGIYLVFCEGQITSTRDVEDSLAAGARAFCLYNYPYAGTAFTGPGRGGTATYAHLIQQGEGLWRHWRGLTAGRFWPTVMPGWDRRPWTRDHDLVRTGSTPALFERSLRTARDYANRDRVVMIEAWNEWGEGSVLEPSTEWRFGYLDRVRKVFCAHTGGHVDMDPASRNLPRPVFAGGLPRIDTWRFDYDAQGWTRSGATELTPAWGLIRTTTTTGDPQLTSPATYLLCAAYDRVRLRMRVEGPTGGPATATGQIFWSTVERDMSERSSVTFPVAMDGAWHVIDVPLRGVAGWTGMMDRCRVDPVDVAGATIDVDEVRFVPCAQQAGGFRAKR